MTAAQELADDWNTGYGKPVARIERVPSRNGAFRGLSRVMFDDGSYLTFVLMGDLTHRDSEFVDMTSFFVFPSTLTPTTIGGNHNPQQLSSRITYDYVWSIVTPNSCY